MRLYTYIARYIVLVGLVITTSLLGTIWLTQSVRFIELALAQPGQKTFWVIIKLTLLLLPDLFAVICPFSFFLAVVYTYNRFLYDREITIMRSIGMSNVQLACPVFAIGVVLACLLMYLNLCVLPYANTQLKTMEKSLGGPTSLAFVKVNEFNSFPGLLFYTRDRDPSGAFHGILAYVKEPSGQYYTIIAQKGHLIRKPQNKISFILENGQKQDINPTTGRYQILTFEKTFVDLDQHPIEKKERQRKITEYSLKELLFDTHEALSAYDQNRLRVEGFNRLLNPFAPLSYMLVGACVLLISSYRRRGLIWPGVSAGFFIMILHAMYMVFINSAVKSHWALVGAYGLIFGGILGSTMLLWLKKMPLSFLQSVRGSSR